MKSLIQTFIDVVKIDSPTGEEKQMAQYLVTYLRKYADVVKTDSYGNVYARVNGVKDGLFFAAHMDTVEPGRGIKPVIKSGYITSDGSTILGADNKLAIACILETVRQIKEQHIPHMTLELLFTRSEEVNNYGAINFNYSFLKSKKGYCFDRSAPVGTIITGSPYYERFDLKVIGREAHASKPFAAINALAIFNEILNKITLGRIDSDTIQNIGVITGGFVRNTVPGEISAFGEIRSFKEKNLLQAKKRLEVVIAKTVKKYSAKYALDFVRENGGYKHVTPSAKKFISTTENTMRLCKIEPSKEMAWGVSDANIFSEKGLLVINLGDGGKFAHSKKERATIREMEKLVRLMIKLIYEKTGN